jgi:hypothetical protein
MFRYEMQDLHVSETLPHLVALSETYMQIYEQQQWKTEFKSFTESTVTWKQLFWTERFRMRHNSWADTENWLRGYSLDALGEI